MSTGEELTQEQIDSFAVQVAGFQDVWEAHGLPLEDPMGVANQLRSAIGPRNARMIVDRMVEIRSNPVERDYAEQNARELHERKQRERGIIQ